jgi:hypothetical protein
VCCSGRTDAVLIGALVVGALVGRWWTIALPLVGLLVVGVADALDGSEDVDPLPDLRLAIALGLAAWACPLVALGAACRKLFERRRGRRVSPFRRVA